MQLKDLESLKEWSKNDESYQKIREVVEGLIEARDHQAKNLELLEAAIESDYDAIVITDLNLEEPGPRIVYVNDRFCEITGYSREEVIGKTPRILQGAKSDKAVLDRMKKQLKAGKSFFGQTVNYRKDGSEFINQWDIHPLKDRNGNITHWVSYQHDITHQKRAEKQYVDLQLDFEELRKESLATVADMDPRGNIVVSNKAFRELTGYSKEELKDAKVWDLFAGPFISAIRENFEQAVKADEVNGREFKGILRHKSGVPVQVKGSLKVMNLKERTLIRAKIENISLQKRILRALQRRNYEFNRLISHTTELSYQIVFEGTQPTVQAVSEQFPQITGISSESLLGKEGLNKCVHEDDIEKVYAHLSKVRSGSPCSCQYRLLSKEGTYVEVLDYGQPKWDKAGQAVSGVYGVVSVDKAYRQVPKTGI